MMTKRLGLIAVLILMTGCATHPEPKPAICDGKHRRPANPYGTVLPTAPDSKAAAPAPGAPPKTAPRPLSSIDPRSTLPCGARS